MNCTIFNKSTGLIQSGPRGEARQDLLTAHYDEVKTAHTPYVSDVPGPGTSLKCTKTFSKGKCFSLSLSSTEPLPFPFTITVGISIALPGETPLKAHEEAGS